MKKDNPEPLSPGFPFLIIISIRCIGRFPTPALASASVIILRALGHPLSYPRALALS